MFSFAKIPGLTTGTATESPKITIAKIATASRGTELAAAETTASMNDTRTTAIHSQKLKRHLVHFFICSPPSAFAAGFMGQDGLEPPQSACIALRRVRTPRKHDSKCTLCRRFSRHLPRFQSMDTAVRRWSPQCPLPDESVWCKYRELKLPRWINSG